jgi:hypothetical protein
MHGATPPLPQYVFMAWCLVKHGDNFTFLLIHAPVPMAVRSKVRIPCSARTLGSWVRIPLEACTYAHVFVFSFPCDRPISHPRSPTIFLNGFIVSEVNYKSEQA